MDIMKFLFHLRILLSVAVLISAFSCVKKENIIIDKMNGMDYPNIEERNSGLGNISGSRDTLKIIVEFAECGEWGGHKESIFLNRDNENNLNARLIVDSALCSSFKNIEDYSEFNDKARIILFDSIKKMTNQDEKLLNLFLHRILELYLNKENLYELEDSVVYMYKDAGKTIHILNTDSSLNIRFYNVDELSNTWYSKIRSQIFDLKKVENKK